MTKQEALNLLDQGATLAHDTFSDNEWIKKDGRYYLFEDGVKCSPVEFWSHRTQPFWDNNWHEYTKCTCNVGITNVFHNGNCIKCSKPVNITVNTITVTVNTPHLKTN